MVEVLYCDEGGAGMDRGRYVEDTGPRYRGGVAGWEGVGQVIQAI